MLEKSCQQETSDLTEDLLKLRLLEEIQGLVAPRTRREMEEAYMLAALAQVNTLPS